MKLPAYKVSAYMAGDLDASLRAVLLYGRNEGAAHHFCKQLIQKKLGDDADPLACIDLEEAALARRPAQLAEEAAQIPMFSPNKVVTIRLRSASNIAVQTYLTQPVAQTLLIVMAGNLTPASALRQAFEASEHAIALPAYEDDEAGLASIARTYLREHDWRIDEDALIFLQPRLGHDRGIIYQELTRLMLYKGEVTQKGAAAQPRCLTLDDVIAAGADNGLASLQNLMDALLAGQLSKADRLLIRLEQFGHSPLAMLANARRHLAQLRIARARLDARLALAEALKSFRPPVHFTRRKAIETQCQTWTQTQIAHAIRALFNSEARCRQAGTSARLATIIARQTLFAIGRLGASLC